MSNPAETQKHIRLKRGDYEAIIAQAAKGLPCEICGLIAGSDADGVRSVEKIYPMTNRDASNEHFTIEPREQLAAMKDMRASGFSPLGNYHSHPETPARPSAEDIRLSHDPSASYIIVSLAGDKPVIKSFHVENSVASEEAIDIL